MKVLAQGMGDLTFVVETKPGFARVVDIASDTVNPELPVQSIAARPGWGPIKNPLAAERAIELVRPKGGELF